MSYVVDFSDVSTVGLESSPVTDARRDSFESIVGAENPGVSVGTTNPRTPSSVRAHTIATSAIGELVIHIFAPFNIHPSACSRAVVRIAPGSEP